MIGVKITHTFWISILLFTAICSVGPKCNNIKCCCCTKYLVLVSIKYKLMYLVIMKRNVTTVNGLQFQSLIFSTYIGGNFNFKTDEHFKNSSQQKKELVFWNPSSTKVVTFIYVGTCLWYNPYYLYIILIFFVTFLYFRVICQIINGTRLLLDDPRGINILWWSMAILLQQLLVGTITISTLMVFFTLVSFTWISLFILDQSPAFLTFWWHH